jgi:thiamine-phosphate pyrophosphorylase
VREAATQGANFAVLAPIFEKVQTDVKGIGLEVLREAAGKPGDATEARLAVLALGGINLTNARACLEAGAAGLAGIRLFQSGDLLETVRQLRAL